MAWLLRAVVDIRSGKNDAPLSIASGAGLPEHVAVLLVGLRIGEVEALRWRADVPASAWEAEGGMQRIHHRAKTRLRGGLVLGLACCG